MKVTLVPAQIVVALALMLTLAGWFGFTVTVTTAVGTLSRTAAPMVEIVIRRYCVVVVKPAGTSYVAAVAPEIAVQLVKGLTALSHR